MPLRDATIELDLPRKEEERMSPPTATATIGALALLSWVVVIALLRMLVG
jgi:hypothetical protein